MICQENFFFDNPNKKWSNLLVLTIKCYKIRWLFLLESLEEYEQDRFEQLNSDYDNDSHESIDKNIDIFENKNRPPDSPIVQLLMSNVKLSLDTSLMFENWEEVELFMDTYSEQGFESKKVHTEKDK